jgi:hypothetical protein
VTIKEASALLLPASAITAQELRTPRDPTQTWIQNPNLEQELWKPAGERQPCTFSGEKFKSRGDSSEGGGEIQSANKMQWIGFNLNTDGNYFKNIFANGRNFIKFISLFDRVE